MALRNGASSTTIPVETDVQALLARIKELEQNQKKSVPVTLKVSEKGAVSVYGIGRFPVTLYASQWGKVSAHIDAIKAFIEANKSKLAVKA